MGAENVLTSLHAKLCCLSLKAGHYAPEVMQHLNNDVSDILNENPDSTGHATPYIDSKSFLLYYYYGGMIYAALGQYRRSLYFFEIVLCTPAMAVSQIMIEAYKKHILVSLILHGQVNPLPNYKPSVVPRSVKPSCTEYTQLASLFTGSTPSINRAVAMRNYLQSNRTVFEKDNNIGLVNRTITALHKRNIQRLTVTFLKLSLADVAGRCQLPGGPAEAETYISRMIECGEISAEIDRENGIVSFKDTTTTFQDQTLDNETENALMLERRVRALDTEAKLNPQYVGKMLKGQSTYMGLASSSSAGPSLFDDEGVSVPQMAFSDLLH